MSIAKVTTVKSARKDQGKCGRCGKEIKKGDGYLHFTVGFRSSYKQVRCTDAKCFPKESERESTAKSGPMSVREEFEDSTFTDIDDLSAAYEDVKSSFNEYADECESALDGWENGNSMLEERSEAARSAADTLDQWEPDEYDGDMTEEDEPVDSDKYEEFVSEQKDNAIQVINEAEGMWV